MHRFSAVQRNSNRAAPAWIKEDPTILQYAKTYQGIGLGVSQAEIKSAQFSGQTQTLQPDATLKQGAIRLD